MYEGGGESLESRDYELMWEDLYIGTDALSAKYGLMKIEEFEERVKRAIEKWLGVKVERWTARDEEGLVFGIPFEVEVEVVVSEGKVILLKILPGASMAGIAVFKREAEFYELKTGVKPSKLIVFSPLIEEKARELASGFGMEIYESIKDMLARQALKPGT